MAYRSLMVAIVAIVLIGSAGAHAQDLSKYPDWSAQWRKPDGIGNGR